MPTPHEIALWAKTRAQTYRIDAGRQRRDLTHDDAEVTREARMKFIAGLEACALVMDQVAEGIPS